MACSWSGGFGKWAPGGSRCWWLEGVGVGFWIVSSPNAGNVERDIPCVAIELQLHVGRGRWGACAPAVTRPYSDSTYYLRSVIRPRHHVVVWRRKLHVL